MEKSTSQIINFLQINWQLYEEMNHLYYLRVYNEGYNKGYYDAVNFIKLMTIENGNNASPKTIYDNPLNNDQNFSLTYKNITYKDEKKYLAALQADIQLQRYFKEKQALIHKQQFFRNQEEILSKNIGSIENIAINSYPKKVTQQVKNKVLQKLINKNEQNQSYLSQRTFNNAQRNQKSFMNGIYSQNQQCLSECLNSQYQHNQHITRSQIQNNNQQIIQSASNYFSQQKQQLFSDILDSQEHQNANLDEFQSSVGSEKEVKTENIQPNDLNQCQDQYNTSNLSSVEQRTTNQNQKNDKHRRKKLNYEQLQLLKRDLQKFQEISAFNESQSPHKKINLLAKKYGVGRTTLYKFYKIWLKDPSLKSIFSKKTYNQYSKQKSCHALTQERFKKIQNIIKLNPFLSGQEIASEIQKHTQEKIGLRIIRFILRSHGYHKKRFRYVALNRNRLEHLQNRKKFCIQFKQYEDLGYQSYYLNLQEICIYPYLQKQIAWVKSGQTQDDVISKQFRSLYLNGLFVFGKNYVDYKITNGFWSNIQQIKIFNQLIQNILYCRRSQYPNSKRVLFVINLKRQQLQPYHITHQSYKKLKVLQNLISSFKSQYSEIKYLIIPPISPQLDLLSTFVECLKQRINHKTLRIQNKEEKKTIEELNEEMKDKLSKYIDELKDQKNQELRNRYWEILQKYIEQGQRMKQF